MQHIEQLETRRLLTAFTASSVAELIADINAANATGGSNKITLTPGSTFKLNASLPAITAGDELSILGNGDLIERGSGRRTLDFRLLEVAPGGSLELNNLTLSRGTTVGGGVFNRGTLKLNGVTVQNCISQGQFGSSAGGGAIWSDNVLSIADSVIQNNQAIGGDGDFDPWFGTPQPGGSAFGGGLYIAGGTSIVANTTFSSNLAQGGAGANGVKLTGGFFSGSWVPGARGGNGFGGAIYVAGGTVEIRGSTMTQNLARGGAAGSTRKGLTPPPESAGQGGGLYIAPTAVVSLDSFTQAHTSGNTASTSDNDIFGSFTVLG